MKKLLAALAVLALFVGLFNMIGTAGAADEDSFSFQIGFDIRRGPQGSEVRIGAADVPKNLQGRTCAVSLESGNNQSIHPQNFVVARSGGDESWFYGPNDANGRPKGVEFSRNAQTFLGSEPLTLGGEIVVSLQFGPNRVTSSGFVLVIECPPPPTTTTVAPTTTTEKPVTTTTTEVPVTTTVPGVTTTLPDPTTTTVVDPPATTVPGQDIEINTSSVAIALAESEPAVPVVAEPQFTG